MVLEFTVGTKLVVIARRSTPLVSINAIQPPSQAALQCLPAGLMTTAILRKMLQSRLKEIAFS
jgi:hypothetical protein